MTELEAYRRMARHYRQLAEAEKDQTVKEDLLRSAAVWDRLAERALGRRQGEAHRTRGRDGDQG